MKNITLFFSVFALLFWAACGGKGKAPAYESEVDLKEHGLALKIKAPADAKVTASDGLVQDIKVEAKDFYVQIYGVDITQTADRKALKAEAVKEVQESASGCTFKRFVLEEDFGFVYELTCSRDTASKFYDFRYLYVRGDREYTFQSTTTLPFTEEQVKNMYEAVKQEKSSK